MKKPILLLGLLLPLATLVLILASGRPKKPILPSEPPAIYRHRKEIDLAIKQETAKQLEDLKDGQSCRVHRQTVVRHGNTWLAAGKTFKDSLEAADFL